MLPINFPFHHQSFRIIVQSQDNYLVSQTLIIFLQVPAFIHRFCYLEDFAEVADFRHAFVLAEKYCF